MCNGYWETCSCEDCKEVKELYEALDFYWDNKEEKEEIIMKIFSCTNATQMQIIMLLDEDKEYIKNLFLKYRYNKINWKHHHRSPSRRHHIREGQGG